MPRRTIRLAAKTDERVQSGAKQRGYSSPSAFLRAAIEKELGGRDDGVIGAEERLAATIEQVRREIFRLGRAQQALFAYLDSFVKVVLTCMPEPTGEATEAAVARARGRHVRLLKSAGQSMVGDSQLAMEDLVNHVEKWKVRVPAPMARASPGCSNQVSWLRGMDEARIPARRCPARTRLAGFSLAARALQHA